jgi:hypothetical protein
MADNETHIYSTANSELHDSYGRYLKLFTAAAVLVHALLLVFFVAPRGEGFEAGVEELEVIDVPPEIKIPPPPEEIARPATPVISEEPVEETSRSRRPRSPRTSRFRKPRRLHRPPARMWGAPSR